MPASCAGPDFDVVISVSEGPLPPDTRILVEYAGGPDDEYRIGDMDQKILFCAPSDREGNPPAATGGGAGEAAAGLAGPGGAGGASSEGEVEAVRCTLWTDGPARLTVETLVYPTVTVPLSAKKGKCTFMTEVVIGPVDGGT